MAKTQKRNLEKNWNESEDQENEINLLEKTLIKNEPANIIRTNAETFLVDEESNNAERILVTQSTEFLLSYTFENLPEWAIPHFRIKYFFESEEGYVMDETTFSANVRNTWVENGEDSSNYTFSLIIIASLFFDSDRIPLYVTASLIFDNPRTFNELQFNKA